MWLVADPDTRIYLLGTMHALPRGTDWHGGKVAEAMRAADALVMELSPDELAAAGAVFGQLAPRSAPLAIDRRLSGEALGGYRRLEAKGGDFGGTWYWNRYPGAQCDTASMIYMPLLEETGHMPSEKYAHAPEILAHCQRIGRQFGPSCCWPMTASLSQPPGPTLRRHPEPGRRGAGRAILDHVLQEARTRQDHPARIA